jgi:crossover junction endodeoxyribonuclease RuvC
MRIIGIDPGSICTGYAVIDLAGSTAVWIDGGVIRPPRGAALPDRLLVLNETLGRVLNVTTPDALVMEECFMGRYAKAALVLGHARGALLVAALSRSIPVHEYAPRLIKQAVTGNGSASKAQVQTMIGHLVRGVPADITSDTADAVAAAMCHYHRLPVDRLATSVKERNR